MATLLVSAMSLGGPGLRANLPENGLVLWQTIASESATVVLLQSSMVWNTVSGRAVAPHCEIVGFDLPK